MATPRLLNASSNRKFGDAFTYKAAYTGAGAKETILTPAGRSVSIHLTGTFNVDVETTLSSQADIEAGTATFIVANSAVATAGVLHLAHCQAFRIKVNSGDPTLQVYAS